MGVDTVQLFRPRTEPQQLVVFRFDDSVIRSHVMAHDKAEAIEIFDRKMGKEYRDVDDGVCEIYQIPDDTILPIYLDGPHFTDKTAREWIDYHQKPDLL